MALLYQQMGGQSRLCPGECALDNDSQHREVAGMPMDSLQGRRTFDRAYFRMQMRGIIILRVGNLLASSSIMAGPMDNATGMSSRCAQSTVVC